MSKEFVKDEMCEFPFECNIAGQCFRASLINIELNFPEENDQAIEHVAKQAVCEHDQALIAVKKAKKHLEK